MNGHVVQRTEHGFGCAADGCSYAIYGTFNENFDASWAFRSHTSQYEPGRAPDIEVDWEVVAFCSICSDYSGRVTTDSEGEGLVCVRCKTRWSLDGSGGERDDA